MTKGTDDWVRRMLYVPPPLDDEQSERRADMTKRPKTACEVCGRMTGGCCTVATTGRPVLDAMIALDS